MQESVPRLFVSGTRLSGIEQSLSRIGRITRLAAAK